MSMNDLENMANVYGYGAACSGLSNIPFRDLDLMVMIKENSEGKEFGWTNRMFDAWSKGYLDVSFD